MPIYAHACDVCGKESEELLPLSAPAPEHCGATMRRMLGTAMIGIRTAGGNVVYPTRAGMGSPWVRGGKPKPQTIGKGHGLGGRRAPPTFKRSVKP